LKFVPATPTKSVVDTDADRGLTAGY
jgi:hypothetical protein